MPRPSCPRGWSSGRGWLGSTPGLRGTLDWTQLSGILCDPLVKEFSICRPSETKLFLLDITLFHTEEDIGLMETMGQPGGVVVVSCKSRAKRTSSKQNTFPFLRLYKDAIAAGDSVERPRGRSQSSATPRIREQELSKTFGWHVQSPAVDIFPTPGTPCKSMIKPHR